MGLEIIVFGQILPHKIGVSDLRSPNSPIQFRYTPNTMTIKYGLRVKKVKAFSFIFYFFRRFLPHISVRANSK